FDTPPIAAVCLQQSGLAIDYLKKLDYIGTERIASGTEKAFTDRLQRCGSIGPELSFSENDARGAEPGAVRPVVSDEGSILFWRPKRFRSGVLFVHVPIGAMR